MMTIPGRIPIRIYPFFWLMIFIIGWLNSLTVYGTLIWAVVILFSVLIHEYGHALTALFFGQEATIELVGIGGVTLRQGPRLSLWKEFIIVLNGPLAGFLLSMAALLVRRHFQISSPMAATVLTITIYANIFWTVVNLLPVHPLDGGKLMSIILEGMFGLRGVSIALLISCIIAVVISVLFFLIEAILGGALFLLLAFESYRAWKSSLLVTPRDQDDSMQLLLKEAEENFKRGDDDLARIQLETLRQKTEQGIIFIAATEDLAEIYLKQRNPKQAYDILISEMKNLSPNGLRLLHQAAFGSGEYQTVSAIGDRVYQIFPGYEVALENALSYSLQGQVKPAIGWLKRTIQDGVPNANLVLKRPEFNSIRNEPDFRELEHRFN